MTKLKSGFVSSEFWLALVSNITGYLVLLGYLTPEMADEFAKAVISVIGGLLSMTATLAYIYGRFQLKQQANTSSNQLSELLNESNSSGQGTETVPYVE